MTATELRVATLLVTAGLLAAGGFCRKAGPLALLLRFPATFLHETAHFAVALVTGGRPGGFTVIPRKENVSTLFGARQRWVLGSVTLRKPGLLSTFPAAMAPLLFLPAAFLLYRGWFRWFRPEILPAAGLGLVVALCLGASVPSRRDLEAAFSRPGGVLLYGTGLGTALLLGDRLLPLVF